MTRRLVFDDEGLALLAGTYARADRSVRVVGGAVRDMLLGQTPKDVDLATDATPEESVRIAVAAGLRVIPTGIRHGTVTVVALGRHFEVTTLRRDVETDGRHALVDFVRDYRVDAARRDFTINAMSATPDGTLHDYFGGLEDLHAGIVRFVGSPADRITEDYLRILRLFRFRTRFGGQDVDPGLVSDLRSLGGGLSGISGERIWTEMSRILVHPNGIRELETMGGIGLLEAIGFGAPMIGTRRLGDILVGLRPAIALGIVLADREAVRAVADRWHLSSREREDGDVAALVTSSRSPDPHSWMCAVADGLRPDVVRAALAASGRMDAAKAIEAGVPRFPILGRDLVAIGFLPGPDLGRLIERLRTEWKESRFSMSRDDLMDSATSADAPRP